MSHGGKAHRPIKSIYFRVFTPFVDAVQEQVLLVDEIREVIPMILKMQNNPKPLPDMQMILSRHCAKPTERIGASQTISKRAFMEILEELNIDKSLITIVEDIEFRFKESEVFQTGMKPIIFRNFFGVRVMFPAQALLCLFRNLICGINWSTDKCEFYSNCLFDYREEILKLFQKYSEMEALSLVTERSLKSEWKDLRSRCHYSIQRVSACEEFDYRLHLSKPDDLVSDAEYSRICELFDLTTRRNRKLYKPFGDHNCTAVTRIFYILGWVDTFFKRTQEKLYIPLFNALCSICPAENLIELWLYLNSNYNTKYSLHHLGYDTESEIDSEEFEEELLYEENAKKEALKAHDDEHSVCFCALHCEQIMEAAESREENSAEITNEQTSSDEDQLQMLCIQFNELENDETAKKRKKKNQGEVKKLKEELEQWQQRANRYERAAQKTEELVKENKQLTAKNKRVCERLEMERAVNVELRSQADKIETLTLQEETINKLKIKLGNSQKEVEMMEEEAINQKEVEAGLKESVKLLKEKVIVLKQQIAWEQAENKNNLETMNKLINSMLDEESSLPSNSGARTNEPNQ